MFKKRTFIESAKIYFRCIALVQYLIIIYIFNVKSVKHSKFMNENLRQQLIQ